MFDGAVGGGDQVGRGKVHTAVVAVGGWCDGSGIGSPHG